MLENPTPHSGCLLTCTRAPLLAHLAPRAPQVRLAMDVDGVVANLLALREAFPRADTARVAGGHPALLRMAPADLAAAAREARGWG